jgi:WD40 repeat protein
VFDLWQDTRTLVVLCAFSAYDPPPASKTTRRQLQTLERVEPTLDRLQTLLASDGCRAAGIQSVLLLNQGKFELLQRLEEIRDAVMDRPGVNMVVFWSGHGHTAEKSFRLAVRNTLAPIGFEDGVGLDEVLRQSGVARVGTWTLFLDACYAGESLGDVVATAHDLLKSETGTLRGYGALCSSSPFEKSRDSVFLETVIDVLAHGPSAGVRAFAESEGGGGMFNPFNKLLSLSELFEAVSNEYRADSGKFQGAAPWPIQGGAVNPRLFPNPQFQAQQPSRLAENAYRAIARASDLDSHFFPKALGIDNLESGWHFAGRMEVTRSILAWMASSFQRTEDRLYVLAAEGGTGKSALLGRLIALTDANYRNKAKAQGWNESLDQQAGTVPEPDCIDAALSLRNLTSQTLAEHLASLLGAGRFGSIDEFVGKLVASYQRPDKTPPCIVLDALDEALEPSAIVHRIIHPLVKAGCKVLVATRRSARAKGASDLIADLGAAQLFELDHDQQSWNDIHAYAQARLAQRPGWEALAEPAARLIAHRADNKFLFARMATSSLLRKAEVPTLDELQALVARDATEALTRELVALDEDFQRSFPCDGGGATAMLTALAWGEGDGVPIRDGIWAAMADAVASLKGPLLRFEEHHILWLLREAGRFIQESGDGEQAVYRLFHKSLVDHFQHSPFPRDPLPQALDDRIAGALLACVRKSLDWAYTNPYLIRHMPAHLALRHEQTGLNQLLLNFDWIQARLNHSGIEALLSDYRFCESAYPATARLHRTLSMIAHILREHPDQLIPQLLGRIRPGVPDIAPLLNGKPGANYSLPSPSQEGLNVTQRLMLQRPVLNVEQQGAGLIDRALSLDGLLERAKASLLSPRWIPELGGLAQAGALVYTLQGHRNRVTSVALSANGRMVASASDDKTVRVWDAKTGQARHTLEHVGAVTSVALSADGFTLVSGSRDHTVRLWDTQTGRALRTLLGHEHHVTCVALSADGKTVISGSDDKTVRVWNADTGQDLHTLHGHAVSVTSVALSADGFILVSGGHDHTVRLWDAQTGEALRTLQGHEGGIEKVALSADGQTVVSFSDDQTVRLWDAQTGRSLLTLHGPAGTVTSLTLSADGRTLVSGSDDRTVYLRDAQTGRLLRMLQGHEYWVTSVAVSADGLTVVSGSDDDTVRLWDARTGRGDPPDPHKHSGTVTGLALSADGCAIVSGSRDKTVRFWNAETGQALRSPGAHEKEVTSVALSADGGIGVSAGKDNTLRLWDVQSDRVLHTLQGHTSSVSSVALSTDGCTVVSGSEDRTLRLWDVQTGTLLRTLRGHQQGVTCVALSADGRTLVSSSYDDTVRVWDVHTGECLRVLHGPASCLMSVALSADGGRVVSGSDDSKVRVWDAQTGQLVLTLQGHTDPVNCVLLSADGRTVFSGSNDRTVRLWDAQTGRLLETLTFDAWVLDIALAEREGLPIMAVASGHSVLRLTRQATAKAVSSPPPSR